MAIILQKLEIDLTFRKYKQREGTDPIKVGDNFDLVLAEEQTFKALNLRTAIQKLIDLLPFNL